MAIIGHVHKTGERCAKAYRNISATEVQFGTRLRDGDWELFYVPRHKTYVVCRQDLRGDFYEVFNFNCATSILKAQGNGA